MENRSRQEDRIQRDVRIGYIGCAAMVLLIVGLLALIRSADRPTLAFLVRAGNTSEVLRRLQTGADPDARDTFGRTALHYCVRECEVPGSDPRDERLRIAQLLIDAGADVDAADKSGQGISTLGWTPLHLAAAAGDDGIAQLLLAAGAAVEMADAQGYTPLHEAARSGHVAITRLLIDAGADIGAVTWGPADRPRAQRRAGPSLWSGTGLRTPLHLAANRDVALLLIEAGADIEARDACGDTPLHSAASAADADVSGMLIQRGALVEAADREGQTPLHKAAISGRWLIVEVLLDSGAQVDLTDITGSTALHYAASGGHALACNALIEAGADVNAERADGATPLDLALANDRAAEDDSDEVSGFLRMSGGVSTSWSLSQGWGEMP